VVHHVNRATPWRPFVAGAGLLTATTALVGAVSAGPAQAAEKCTPNVGNTGLSAAVVAHAHQRIAHRTIDATGCDIGIFVGQNVSHVAIDSVTVSHANFQGILAQKTSHVTIEDSTVTDNGFNTLDPSAPALPSGVHSFVGQSFAISLFGVSYSTVKDNKVYNNGRGGIGLMDNGPNDPGARTQDASAPLVPSSHDTITGNSTWANYNGCGIVAATQNLDGRLSDLTIAENSIRGTGMSQEGPDIGGIVTAADLPGSSVTDVQVRNNTVKKSFEGGIIVNSEAFNSFTKDVRVTGNTVEGNNTGDLEAPQTAGVIVFANPGASVPPTNEAPENIGTTVAHNVITQQFYGICSVGHFPPSVSHNDIRVTKGGTPVFIG
jgi:hypothetical protein